MQLSAITVFLLALGAIARIFTSIQVNILLAIFTFNFATVMINVATWILAVYVFLVVAAHKLEIEQGEEDSRYGIIIQRVLVF